MKANEILDKAKELVAKGDLSKAKEFIENNKDHLGEHYEKAKILLDKADLGGKANDAINKVKGLFGK